MESLYHQTNKLVQETQHLFSNLERKSSDTDLQEIKAAIESKINLINSNCERLDVLCLKGPVSQRQNTRMRVDQLKYDSRHLSAALNSWCNRVMRQQREEAEREALLARKFTSNDHGSGVLDNLKSQRLTLKGAHKRLIDIGNTLGLSNTTMRLIEQRARQDGFILVAGMTFTCLVIVLVILYLR
ncbi:PREDICTED: probable Golgi SNAP receptor complex member 2 isoform X2 [Dinoponera quadriceps]|uniref:Probable Golgi SNAP receptor complex member 2 isoform X2 n=1 Tax=Dinoponera quadriceps TaxID=609295 RepID=A0A6P3WRU6_DINQU|nr:PREDICTED: probable Golgi SNAP receptor complex member 2 isoform X2 [Dinoponera quadriceps]